MMRVSESLRLVSSIAQKMSASAKTVRHRSKLRALPTFRPEPAQSVDVLLNFPGEIVNMYQVRQWYGPLEHLAQTHRVAILCYQPSTAELVAQETDLKVVLTPSYTDLREVENELNPKVILYPNQNYANYRILGLTEAEHVFICHGESDKIYMASNWVKVFNYFFVAGDASRDRLRKHVRNYDVDARTIAIGRPQIDIEHKPPIAKLDGRITVLYSPTWEGGRRTMRYGSVASHGVGIVSSLLADDRYRVIYRPHPRTGIHEPEFESADRQIRELISQANQSSAGLHFIDDTPFGWQLDVADAMITDISAVAYDWLTTAKPLLVTRPVEPEAVMPQEGFMSELPLLDSDRAKDTAHVIDSLLTDANTRSQMTTWADYHYGDRSAGNSLSRFVGAIDSVISQRDGAISLSDMATGVVQTRPIGNTIGECKREHAPSRAEQGLTFAKRSFDFATTGIANLAAQSRADTQITGTPQSAVSRRHTDILVSTMAGPHDIDTIVDWVPSLEVLNNHCSVSLLAGNQRTYEKLRDSTSLRVLIGRSASETEELFTSLQPTMHLQFEQANLNLRELTHRSVFHAYVGSDTNTAWVNNRLRAFDAIVTNSQMSPEMIRNTLLDFPSQTKIVTVPDAENTKQSRAATIAGVYSQLATASTSVKVNFDRHNPNSTTPTSQQRPAVL